MTHKLPVGPRGLVGFALILLPCMNFDFSPTQ